MTQFYISVAAKCRRVVHIIRLFQSSSFLVGPLQKKNDLSLQLKLTYTKVTSNRKSFC